jgi:hypothetical protein
MGERALEMGSLERTLPFCSTEVTFVSTLGKRYHFVKPIHHFKNLVRMEQKVK